MFETEPWISKERGICPHCRRTMIMLTINEPSRSCSPCSSRRMNVAGPGQGSPDGFGQGDVETSFPQERNVDDGCMGSSSESTRSNGILSCEEAK